MLFGEISNLNYETWLVLIIKLDLMRKKHRKNFNFIFLRNEKMRAKKFKLVIAIRKDAEVYIHLSRQFKNVIRWKIVLNESERRKWRKKFAWDEKFIKVITFPFRFVGFSPAKFHFYFHRFHALDDDVRGKMIYGWFLTFFFDLELHDEKIMKKILKIMAENWKKLKKWNFLWIFHCSR